MAKREEMLGVDGRHNVENVVTREQNVSDVIHFINGSKIIVC